MYNFETGRFIAPHRSGMPLVPGLPFTRSVLEDNFRCFEHLDGQRMRSVLANGL